MKLYPTGYAKKEARKSTKRTKPRNRIKKGYHSEEERVIVSNETSEIDDSEYDIVAKDKTISEESESKSSDVKHKSIRDKDEDFESNDSSSFEDSSPEVAESESSESVAKENRKIQPKVRKQTRNKPSAKKSVISVRRSKAYEEDKPEKTAKPKVAHKMNYCFDEIHYRKTKRPGYITERDDLDYIKKSDDGSSEESKDSSHLNKRKLSHKPESESESDKIIDEKLELLNEGIKENFREM